MYTEEQVRKIWTNTYFDALGCGETDDTAEAIAHKKIAPYVAAQKRAEHFARYPSGRVPQPNQAGQRQYRERHAR